MPVSCVGELGFERTTLEQMVNYNYTSIHNSLSPQKKKEKLCRLSKLITVNDRKGMKFMGAYTLTKEKKLNITCF